MQAWLATVLFAGALCGCELGYVAPYEDYGVPVGTYTATAPPAPLDEIPLSCGYGDVYIPGYWDYDDSRWLWRSGQCVLSRPGLFFVPPYFSGGLYYRGYWTSDRFYGPRYLAPPSAVLPNQVYRAPPAPVIPNRTYIAPPAPVIPNQTYIAPPAPSFPNRVYVAPPAPATSRGYVAPNAAGGHLYVPAPPQRR